MEQTLQLVFRNVEGSLFTIALANPREDLSQAEVAAAMDVVIARDIFQSNGGPLVSKVRARLVSREVVDIAVFE